MLDLRSVVIGLVLMLKKYSCLSLTIYEEANEEDYKNGIIALPIIGLAIGFVAFIIVSFRYIYDGFFISSAVLLYYCVVTKTSNIKDVYRTLNYYIRPANQTDNISGIIGTVLICLMYLSLFRVVPVTSLIIMPAAGFSNLMILSKVIKRDLENTSILKYCGSYHIIAAFGISFLSAAIINYKLIISLSITFMLSGLIVSILDKRIKNVPSSVEGFIIEVSQVMFLIITYIIRFGDTPL
jgi:cobalamin synthase